MSKESKVIKGSKVANMLASTALTVAGVAANTKCVFIYHQPKAPDGMKNLRKF